MTKHYTMPQDEVQIYGGTGTLYRTPYCDDIYASKADVIVTGAPLDMCTTGRSGARQGPQAIRMASTNLIWEEQRFPWDFTLADRLSVEDCGNIGMVAGDPRLFSEQLETHIGHIVEAGKKPLTLGGDHFVALPCIRALAKHHGPLALIHFDAHTDTYDEGELDHGTMFHHGWKEGHIVAEKSVQIGIRTLYRGGPPYQVLSAPWCHDHTAADIVAAVRERVGDHPCYVTFDIDCLDPAFAPGTGTPVVGGLNTDTALKVIRGLKGLNMVGMDLVEVAPAYDNAEITALAGATLCLEWLYTLAAE